MNKKVFISLFLIIFISLSCSVEKKDWEKAESEDTIFAYERFLDKHPDGALAEKARERIENFYFNEAATVDSIQAYEKFLKSYSQGSHTFKARLRIEELRFEEAEYENTIPAYEYYLENFPQGFFVDKAKKKIEEIVNERHQAFREAETAKIMTKLTFPEGASLPIQEVSRRILMYAGLKVVGADVKDSDMRLKIVARGEALGATYMSGGYLYTGAIVSGTISLESRGKPVLKKTFHARDNPPDTTFGTYESEPAKAHFWLACVRRNSFLPKLMELMQEGFGSNILYASVKDMDINVRREAMQTIGKEAEGKGIEYLIKLSCDPKLGFQARTALMDIGSPAFDALITALKDKDKEIRYMAAYSFAQMDKSISIEKVLEPLLDALEDDYIKVQRQAVWALRKIKDKRSVEALISALDSMDREVRNYAAMGLSWIKDARSVDTLISALEDEDEDIRENASHSLMLITNKHFGQDFQKWQEWWAKNKKYFLED